ncbi:MAG: GNAT family N-acetyltransferase [Nocardioidaceae bacterium]|nr:GNAT family N-acetyltransferase [Nocardioidaceae bacterium]NUS50693.1 GNAT family N-acetyltransferase [Nocardioidaceae bacterium]
MEIREVDVHDEPSLHRYWEIGKLADAASRPYDFFAPWESARMSYVHGRDDVRFELLGAYDGSTMVGAGRVDLNLLDNLHAAYVEVWVDPSWQRRGVGRALEAECVQVARSQARRTLMTEAYAPIGQESPGTRFAEATGYAPGLEDAMKVVDLVETEPTWAALEAKAAEAVGDYRVVTWRDHVPDEYLDDYCRLNEMFFDEAPTGEMDVQNEVWDAQRVAAREERNRLTGRHELSAGAVSPDGRLVAVTEAIVNVRAAQRGHQSGTLVEPAHRGHRLGLAVKLANHRQIREAFPQCRVLLTGNADVNAPMNAVNTQLGYRDVERCVELQKTLG